MKYVLFVCTHNAGRSQMAQASFEHHARRPRRIGALGAGVRGLARGRRGDERGRHRPPRAPSQEAQVEMQLHADWAVTMGCGDVCPYVPTTVEDWDLPDPAGKSLEAVREIREPIEERVRDLVIDRLEAIQSDRTVHQLRLVRLLPPLVKEFGDRRSDAEIRACADAVLSQYADAPVRSFAMTLAHRRTRECLQRETCDMVTA